MKTFDSEGNLKVKPTLPEGAATEESLTTLVSRLETQIETFEAETTKLNNALNELTEQIAKGNELLETLIQGLKI